MHLTEYLGIFFKAKYFQLLEFRTLRGSGLLAGQSSMVKKEPTPKQGMGLIYAGCMNQTRMILLLLFGLTKQKY